MTPHDQISRLLARRIELSAAEEARVQTHLQGCRECAATAAAYARQTVLLRSLPEVAPPPALRAGVLAGMAHPKPVPFWARLRPAMLAAPALAAVVIVIAGIAFSHRPQNHSSTAAAPSASSVPTSTQRATVFGHLTHTPGSKPATATPHATAQHSLRNSTVHPTSQPNPANLPSTQVAAAVPSTPVLSPYAPIVPTAGQRPAPGGTPGATLCRIPCAVRHSGSRPRSHPTVAAPVNTAVASPVAPTFGSASTPTPTPNAPTVKSTPPPLPTAAGTPPVASVVTPHPTVAAPIRSETSTPVPAPPPVLPTPTTGIAAPVFAVTTPTPMPTPTPTSTSTP